MKKMFSTEKPTLLLEEGFGSVVLRFGTEEATQTIPAMNEDEEPQTIEGWEYYTVRMNHPLDRSRIIDAIVRAEYPDDRMQAIINNHLLDPSDEDDLAEFTAMQEWRSFAKFVAGVVSTIFTQ